MRLFYICRLDLCYQNGRKSKFGSMRNRALSKNDTYKLKIMLPKTAKIKKW